MGTNTPQHRCKNCNRRRFAGEDWEILNFCSDECFEKWESRHLELEKMHERQCNALAFLGTIIAGEIHRTGTEVAERVIVILEGRDDA